MLSRLYKYADITYVGGGLRPSGVHNVLEAAVYDKTVLIGPHYEKYSEAIGLVDSGGAIALNDSAGMSKVIGELLNDPNELARRNKVAGEFVRSRGGATGKIMTYIQEKRLLTN